MKGIESIQDKNILIGFVFINGFGRQLNLLYLYLPKMPRSFILKPLTLLLIAFFYCAGGYAQQHEELDKGWKCIPAEKIKEKGWEISRTGYNLDNWMPAVVPGTVLTTLLYNGRIPDPFFGMNNKHIPDIYDAGREYYTYWFVKDFQVADLLIGGQVWLHLRGVNDGCDIYLNGHKLNEKTHRGMFLRQVYNITPFINKDNNRLAIIVYPPDPVGNAEKGQGGDGRIARNVGSQFTAGWDWIQPVHDRNTGIWDRVWITTTGPVQLRDPHVITEVPGTRFPGEDQQAAIIKVSADLNNPTGRLVTGVLKYTLEGNSVLRQVAIPAKTTVTVRLPDLLLKHPELWWPNGYGQQHLYHLELQFLTKGKTISDRQKISFGVRSITTAWDAFTKSMKIFVNGQPIFIKGGNWIASDEMLRLSPERYDAEIRFHRDMNLNLVRIWGGSLTERPEFYDACDRYGLLVMQDFWISGDCNGRWQDPVKKDDQWVRRQYPDDHRLFLSSAADQVKMIRNHPSLAIWCGGNEMTPPEDILRPLRDSILPLLDGTRWFVDYSNSDSMSCNDSGGNGDGPYGIQPVSHFWSVRSFPFNSEVGSVGMGDYASLKRFIPEKDLIPPDSADKPDSVWQYHKYIGYGNTVSRYGPVKNIQGFTEKAQLVNYDQYRALMEGFSAHMWDWYTGVIIWKTQNPWTALRGQLYDYYLDPNAGLYGLHKGGEPLHVMYDPVQGMVDIVNNTFQEQRNLMLQVKLIDMSGRSTIRGQVFEYINPSSVKSYLSIGRAVANFTGKEGGFLLLRLMDTGENIISENFYWLPDAAGNYSGMQQMVKAKLKITARYNGKNHITVSMSDPENNPVALFNRISLVDVSTKERLLPVFYSDNYISVMPGESREIDIDYSSLQNNDAAEISVNGWNVPLQYIAIDDQGIGNKK